MRESLYRFKKKEKDFPHKWYERINPTVWLFAIALVLFLIGLSSPQLVLLAWIGGFILTLYVVIWIVWIVFTLN